MPDKLCGDSIASLMARRVAQSADDMGDECRSDEAKFAAFIHSRTTSSSPNVYSSEYKNNTAENEQEESSLESDRSQPCQHPQNPTAEGFLQSIS